MVSHEGLLILALVLLALPSLTHGETLHVRPTSSNTSCSTLPCHTLSEYARDLEYYFNESNLALQFLPGDHSLDVQLTISSIQKLEIFSNSSAGVSTRLVCSSKIGFIFRDISKVRINGLTFVSCSKSTVVVVTGYLKLSFFGVQFRTVETAEIIDCTFQDSYGSALGILDSHVILSGNNSFINNCRLCSNGSCDLCYGGGVFAKRSNLTVTDSSNFIGTSAYSGGGIHAETDSNVYIGGNTTFINNPAKTEGGGVFAHTNSIMDISGKTTFTDNRARYGGGVFASSNSNVNIHWNTTFMSNSGTYGGGGIYASFKCNISISGNTTFIGNTAIERDADGGGIYAYWSNMILNGTTTFINNSAGRNGGGIYSQLASAININGNTTFSVSLRHGQLINSALNAKFE